MLEERLVASITEKAEIAAFVRKESHWERWLSSARYES